MIEGNCSANPIPRMVRNPRNATQSMRLPVVGESANDIELIPIATVNAKNAIAVKVVKNILLVDVRPMKKPS